MVHSVLMAYGLKAWAIKKVDEKWLLVYKRGILKRIYCPIKVGKT